MGTDDEAMEDAFCSAETADIVATIDLEVRLREALELLEYVANAGGWRELDDAQKRIRAWLDARRT